jgi:cysteine-rich repeat protein
MKIFQKLIATILIIAMISTLAWNIFLYKPKKAQAMDLGGSWATFSQTLLQVIKDLGLDTIARGVARSMMVKIQRDLIRWAQGGFSDENRPFAMMDWGEELLDSLNIASAVWLQEHNLTSLCKPFRVTLDLGTYLGSHYYAAPTYQEYAFCTFDRIYRNAENFWRNPMLAVAIGNRRLTGPGAWNARWNAWIHTSMDKANIYGSYITGAIERDALETTQKEAKKMELVTNQGYKNEGICNKAEGEECRQACYNTYATEGPPGGPDYNKCLQNCEIQAGLGVCIDRTVTKLGSSIHSGVEKAIGSDIEWLITTDEITELIGVFFSALLNKAIHGVSGLVAKPQYKAPAYRETYSYFRGSRSSITPQLGKDIRSEVLSSIFKNLGQMNRRTIQCGEGEKEQKKKQMRIEQLAEALPEMLEGEVQHLYTGTIMVNLKSDYKVLDPVNAPFTVYGRTWDDIPFEQYPSRCAKLTKEFGNNITCKDIQTRLPFNLNISNINAELGISGCTATCLNAINEYLRECAEQRDDCLIRSRWDQALSEDDCNNQYRTCENNAISRAINDGKCTGAPPPPGTGSGGGGGGKEEPETPYMLKLEKPMIPFEKVFAEARQKLMPISLGQIIGSDAEQCVEGARLIQKTRDRCEECLKKAQTECESETDPELREVCIEGEEQDGEIVGGACNNFEDINNNITNMGLSISLISDGMDFYGRCSIASKKDSCEVCLKEYFVPATYCHQILDYMARAFIKYPAVVYIEDFEDSWIVKILKGIPILGTIFSWLFGSSPEPGNWWIGWYDSSAGCANNKDAPEEEIPVGLICRAFTEFKHEGSNICARCEATPKERRDIVDFEPTNADCGYNYIGEALPPEPVITAAVFKARTKCCAALADDPDVYRACRFGEKITPGTVGPGVGKSPVCKVECRRDVYRPCMAECSRVAPPECSDACERERDDCYEGCPEIGCGNWYVDRGEECDDGNTVSGDGCSADCMIENGGGEGICGDGNLDAGEECDDGNTVSGDGCSADCTTETVAGVCSGDVYPCRDYDYDPDGCAAHDGCRYAPVRELCGDFPAATACSEFTTQTSCENQEPCTWTAQ